MKKIYVIKISIALLLGIVLIAIVFLYKNYLPDNQNNNATKDKLLKEASLVRIFEITGAASMEKFCSETGHIPVQFINDYKTRFHNTFLNANDILKQKNYTIDNKLYEIYLEKGVKQIDIDYKNFNAEKPASKKEFCQFYDTERNLIIELIAKDFKIFAPTVYKD